MISPARLAEARRLIEEAPIVPPAPEPWHEAAPEPEPVRLRNLPIGLFGVGQAMGGENVERFGIGQAVFVYRDSFGRRRALSAEQHDRVGIKSLFILYEKTLAELWPRRSPRAGFDHHHASEALIADQGRVGSYWPKQGEQLAAEAANRGYLLIAATRFAWQTMQRFGDPYLTLCRLRSWNPQSDSLADSDLVSTVDRLCRRLLRRKGNSHG